MYVEVAPSPAQRSMLVEQTLAWVNEQRAVLDLPPLDDLPRGRRWSVMSCPVAQCFRDTDPVFVTRTFTDLPRRSVKLENPEPAQAFIREFDAGSFPEYEG